MSFAARGLGYEFGLREVSFELPERGLVAIVGPNGAGKSTLLGVLGGLRRDYRGSATFQGRGIRDWSRKEFAGRVATVPQLLRLEFPFTAEEVVLMGRSPFAKGWFETPEDHRAAERAMETTDVLAFRSRDIRTLSGGERQRVILAAALAQEPQTLLLDEPATFLDLHHQLRLYQLLAGFSQRMLVLAVTHDLNLALQFASHVIVLHQGRVAALGCARTVLTAPLISEVFSVPAAIQSDPQGNLWLTYSPEVPAAR